MCHLLMATTQCESSNKANEPFFLVFESDRIERRTNHPNLDSIHHIFYPKHQLSLHSN